jgi:sulfur-oxidizing protein SoxZ
MARVLIHLPERAAVGEVIEIRTTIAHPMETGYRADSEGRTVPRDILRSFVCEFEGETVFRAELHPAVAAYPYFAFHLRASRSGTLAFTWRGDHGFVQTETRPLVVG